MGRFVHCTSEDNLAHIKRNGIVAGRNSQGGLKGRFVFAMPVTPDFHHSHQWVREMRRFNPGRIIGVYFSIPDDENVIAGRYNKAQYTTTAAKAVAEFLHSPCLGFQVMILRSIRPGEIKRIKHLPQLTGWRYYPEAKGREPCGCDVCQRGEYGGRKLREKYEEN